MFQRILNRTQIESYYSAPKSVTYSIRYPLASVLDSTVYSYNYIHPLATAFDIKVPAFPKRYWSLSRSLYLKGPDKEIPVMIGRTGENVDFIVIDKNSDYDLTNDPIEYFPDTLTSPTKGNYKTFNGKLKVADGQTLDLVFDYSIIKPVQLNIDHGDSIENRIHFIVRPHQYLHTTLCGANKKMRSGFFQRIAMISHDSQLF